MANGHGGKRPGAGRKPGQLTSRTCEIRDKAAEAGITPLEYMLAVLRDDAADPNRRDRMAVAAAPYIHARLATIEAKVDTLERVEAKITFEERRREAVEAVRQAFAERPSEREVELAAEKAREVEQRSSGPDRDQGEHADAEAGPERPMVREFAREGELESAPSRTRL